jgi:hypothetical protein
LVCEARRVGRDMVALPARQAALVRGIRWQVGTMKVVEEGKVVDGLGTGLELVRGTSRRSEL